MALIRTVSRGLTCVHVYGVEAYASARGGEELFALLQERKPGNMLMESFAAPDQVYTGDEVPYRKHLHSAGLQKALNLLSRQDFRERLSSEVVGVLGALRGDTAVRFGDRLHTVSFDRLVARVSMEEMLSLVAGAAEKFATVLQENKVQATAESPAPWAREALLQNVLCPVFKELWDERHAVMASVTENLLRESERDVVLVVGSRHVEPLHAYLEQGPKNLDCASLLQAPEDSATWQAQLEKRAALAALLVSTRAFPAEYVLPSSDEMLPEAKEVVRPVYTRCRQAIMERLGGFDTFEGPQGLASTLQQQAPQVLGLGQLEDLCTQLAE